MTVTVNAHKKWKPGEQAWLEKHVGDLNYGWSYGKTIEDEDIQEMIFEREDDAVMYTLMWIGP